MIIVDYLILYYWLPRNKLGTGRTRNVSYKGSIYGKKDCFYK